MTFYSHVDPNFGSVYSIQAINEPIMDSSKTPGYGQCRSTLPWLPTPTKGSIQQSRRTSFRPYARLKMSLESCPRTTLLLRET